MGSADCCRMTYPCTERLEAEVKRQHVSSRAAVALVGLLLVAAAPPPAPESRARSSSVRPEECPQAAAPQGRVMDALRGLLAEGQYAELESRLAAYDKAATLEPACEYHVWTAYEGLAEGGASTKPSIDRWVAQRPTSA